MHTRSLALIAFSLFFSAVAPGAHPPRQELLTSQEEGGGLRVGMAEADITPPVGFPMAGYYHERLAELLAVRNSEDGTVRGILSNFALHLDTVGGMRWSADYPFFIEQTLRENYGADVISIFGTGCCGDINHVDPSTPKRNKADYIGDLRYFMSDAKQTSSPFGSVVLSNSGATEYKNKSRTRACQMK